MALPEKFVIVGGCFQRFSAELAPQAEHKFIGTQLVHQLAQRVAVLAVLPDAAGPPDAGFFGEFLRHSKVKAVEILVDAGEGLGGILGGNAGAMLIPNDGLGNPADPGALSGKELKNRVLRQMYCGGDGLQAANQGGSFVNGRSAADQIAVHCLPFQRLAGTSQKRQRHPALP